MAATASRETVSIKTPGLARHRRLALAGTSYRDERTVAKWWRREPLPDRVGDSIDEAAATLGITRPAPAVEGGAK